MAGGGVITGRPTRAPSVVLLFQSLRFSESCQGPELGPELGFPRLQRGIP